MWIETLRLTSSLTAKEHSDVNRFIDSELGDETSGSPRVMSLANASIPGDRMIILRWEKGEPQLSGSNPALRLVRGLKRYGLVDHAVWV